MFNDLQWTGDYIGAGINGIRLEAGTGATAAEQQAMQFSGRDGVPCAAQQSGEGGVGRTWNRHR